MKKEIKRFSFFKTVYEFTVGLVVVALVIGLIGGCVAIKWDVYHQRFPNASPWTFMFK
jgi:hypothetical protein